MRTPVIVALLATLILVAHLALPFAWIEVRDEGAVTERSTLSRFDMADRLATDQAPDVASLGYLLASAITVTVAGAAFLVAAWLPASARLWTRFGAGGILGLGAAMALHGNGLWAGRSVGLLHGIFYHPALPRDHEAIHELAAGDTFTRIVPISPFVIVVLAMALLFFLVRAWVPHVRDERGMQRAAARHGRLALLGAVVLLSATLIPWVVQELDDNLSGGAGTDHFIWSAYDIMQMRGASELMAEASGEAGLRMWGGLDITLGFLMLAGIAAIVGPLLALAGKDLESAGRSVLGRLLENTSLVAIASHTFAIVAAVLGAFFLHHPLDFQKAVTTGLPLLLVVPAGIALVAAGLVARDVVAVDTDLVADDYPEPVVYE